MLAIPCLCTASSTEIGDNPFGLLFASCRASPSGETKARPRAGSSCDDGARSIDQRFGVAGVAVAFVAGAGGVGGLDGPYKVADPAPGIRPQLLPALVKI